MVNKNITKNFRKSQTINYILVNEYVIFINFLNKDALNLFKKLIKHKALVNVVFINNILKKKYYNKNILSLSKKFNFLKGGVHAIICKNLQTFENILNLFSMTDLYKDKYNLYFKTLKIKHQLPLSLGFITQIKISSYFFNFNSQFLNFFFFFKNERDNRITTFFSRQISVATIWLYQSFIMISLNLFFYLISVFFFLTKQLFFFISYANKKSITS